MTAKKKGRKKGGGGYMRKVRAYVSRHAKKPSLLIVATVAGIIVTITGFGSAQLNAFYKAVSDGLKVIGVTIAVNGATIYMALVALALACTFAPDMVGRPVNNLLGRFGVRL